MAQLVFEPKESGSRDQTLTAFYCLIYWENMVLVVCFDLWINVPSSAHMMERLVQVVAARSKECNPLGSKLGGPSP